MAYVPTLKTQYKEQIVAALMKEFGYSSVMQCPKLTKIVINQGMGQAVADKKLIDVAEAELTQITGQKAVQTRSRKDISNFKLRKGMPIGVRVTLRDTKMYEFLQRLIAVALPRIRDFKGINEKFDGQGNYTLGITEQIIFPEIDIDKITKIFGMEITFVTTAKTDEEAYALLREFGLPFKTLKESISYGKESMKAREVKRVKLANRYAHKREEIAAKVKSGEMDHEEAWIALSKLPRNSNPIRQHNRCKITGRPKGYIRLFGISRIQFREMASKGLIPGVKKASW